ncbi:MAG: hypothetical protein PUF37_02010 [Prevotellaceae bacterium]|nr:hypothetical protein [Prevotellaceae bacterium]
MAKDLADVVPYDDDDASSVTYISNLTGKAEKANPAKTGCTIGSLNRRILGIARDAARLFMVTGDSSYELYICPGPASM